ncbi:hypothetical protein D3C84_998990 [compost metagenome]
MRPLCYFLHDGNRVLALIEVPLRPFDLDGDDIPASVAARVQHDERNGSFSVRSKRGSIRLSRDELCAFFRQGAGDLDALGEPRFHLMVHFIDAAAANAVVRMVLH